MAVLVLYMDMPNSCDECPIYKCPWDSMSRNERAEGCPLREVKLPKYDAEADKLLEESNFEL